MAEIINFNKARKRRAREDAAKLAAENRAKFGRTKAQKEHEAAEADEAQRKLDLLKRDKPEDDA
jgi:hypothetical protein